jgi:adenylate kinase family enzyme
MKRVLVIGGNGSGKTTMSRELSEITGLPLCHLDALYWLDGWVPRPKEEFDELLGIELEKPEWILDGNFRRTLPRRLEHCDTVVYLDYSGIRCFFGVLGRILTYRGSTRPDMGGECIESFNARSLRFLFGTLTFNKKNRPYLYGCLKEHPELTLVVLKNRRQLARWLAEIRRSHE